MISALDKVGLCHESFWAFCRIGRMQDGTTLVPVFERGIPPRLAITDRIRHKTLDELVLIFRDLIQEAAPNYSAIEYINADG